jgi:hypothetical protein
VRVRGAAIAVALTVIAACRAKPATGGQCHAPDQLVCANGDLALVCVAPGGDEVVRAAPGITGKWFDVPCKGAHRCAHQGTTDECDDTIAEEGDHCPPAPPVDYACTSDKKRALVCQRGQFLVWRQCRGPDACQVVDDRKVQCDTTLGEPGDPCAQDGAYACSVDRGTMLRCDGATLAAASTCRGPKGCQVQRDTRNVDCDDAIAQEGDPCDYDNRPSCSVDKKSELVCKGKTFAFKRACRRTDCRVEGNELFCD